MASYPDEFGVDGITKQVIGAAHTVGNALGSGFLEKVYENALAIEIRKTGLKVQQQFGIAVRYEGSIVGEYVADLVIEEKVLVELKATEKLDDAYFAQCLNYLKATGLRVCLLINFGTPRVEVRRIVR